MKVKFFKGYYSTQRSLKSKTFRNSKKINRIRHDIKISKIQYFNKHLNNLPSVNDRYLEVFKSLRYGKSIANIDFAKIIAENKSLYLKHSWQNSPSAQKLNYKLALTKMKPLKKKLYQKAKQVLTERHLYFEPVTLAAFDNKTLLALAKGKFTDGKHILLHGHAYYLNSVLRQSLEIKDTILSIIEEGFRNLNPLKNPVTSYRTVSGHEYDGSIKFIQQLINSKKGDIIIDKGFSYSTLDKNSTLSGNCNNNKSPEVTIKMLIPEKAKVSYIAKRNQSEVLCDKNSAYEVIEEAKIVNSAHVSNYNSDAPYHSDNKMEMTVLYVVPR